MRQAILGKTTGPIVSPTVWFAFRFLFISITLFLLMEIAPDALFYPLNRINAILATGMLKIFGLAPSTRGLTIMLEGFRAQVIGRVLGSVRFSAARCVHDRVSRLMET